MMPKYRTFKRSCTSWDSFSQARKYTDMRGLTYEEAQRRCAQWNASRTPAQIKNNTKMEFTQE